MQLADYLDKELVLPDLSGKTKSEALRELVAPLQGRSEGIDPDQAYAVLLEREKLGTTGIGDGVAIPHGKLDSLERIIVAVGRSTEGIDFDALDFSPCHIFFLVLAPEQVAGMHLKVLAHISRLIKDEEFRKRFLTAQGRDGLWDLLSSV